VRGSGGDADSELSYSNSKRVEEAEALYRRALAGKERQLGAEHPPAPSDDLLNKLELAA